MKINLSGEIAGAAALFLGDSGLDNLHNLVLFSSSPLSNLRFLVMISVYLMCFKELMEFRKKK